MAICEPKNGNVIDTLQISGCYTQPYYHPSVGSGLSTYIYPYPPAPTPQLVRVAVVRTKAGWLGQIVYRQEIAWESKAQETEFLANEAALKQLEKALSR